MTLQTLEQTIIARKSADPSSSWTAKLLAKGPEKCAEKFGEEAIEAIIEAVKGDRQALTSPLMMLSTNCHVDPACLASMKNLNARRGFTSTNPSGL